MGPGADVVDVACGPGTLALQVAPRANRVAALDFSPAMIAQLCGHVGYAQLGNIDAAVGDGQALPYGDGEFDFGFSMFGLMFFPDRARGLAELRRVVKPGGRVVVSSWVPLEGVPALDAVFGAMRAAAPPLPSGAAAPPPFVPALGDEATIHAEFGAAGFSAIVPHRVEFSTEHASTEVFLESMDRTLAPLVLMRDRMGAEAFAPVRASIRAAALAAVGHGPQTITMPAWLTVATR